MNKMKQIEIATESDIKELYDLQLIDMLPPR